MVVKPWSRIPRLLGHTWGLYNAEGRYLAQRLPSCRCRAQSSLQSSEETPSGVKESLVWSAYSTSTPAIIRELRRSLSKQHQELLSKPRIPLLVILLTPRHVSLLDDLYNSIGSHLHANFPRVDKERCLDVLVAVVDRIPNSANQPSRLPPHDGFEGMSVAYLDSENAAPNLWSRRKVSKERDTMTIQQRCTISFAIRGIRETQELQKIQLPVANTLFLNGRLSTLAAQRWVQHPYEAADGKLFEMLEQKSLPEQVINFTPTPSAGYFLTQKLQSHLKKITKPRKVAASTGNIIQKIYASDGSEALPASQELEEAIHKKIRDGEMPSHSPDVWALITPKKFPYFRTIADIAVAKGRRLHKVLSGGGGWGVKQGLLSLDPDCQYKSISGEPEDMSLPAFRNNKSYGSQLFENIVNLGEAVTFYMNMVPTGPVQNVESSDRIRVSREATPCQYLYFGTIPSTMDATRAGVEAGTNADSNAEAVRVTGFFGALSEQGMSLEVGFP